MFHRTLILKKKKVLLKKQRKGGSKANTYMFHVDHVFQGQHLKCCMDGSFRKTPNYEHIKGPETFSSKETCFPSFKQNYQTYLIKEGLFFLKNMLNIP